MRGVFRVEPSFRFWNAGFRDLGFRVLQVFDQVWVVGWSGFWPLGVWHRVFRAWVVRPRSPFSFGGFLRMSIAVLLTGFLLITPMVRNGVEKDKEGSVI